MRYLARFSPAAVQRVRTCLAVWCGVALAAGYAAAAEPAPAADAPVAEKAAKPAPVIRLLRDDNGQPTALQTAILKFAPAGAAAGATVDLVGVIHVGDKDYYHQLNRLFTEYDAVLYELVAPENHRQAIQQGAQRDGGHPVSAMQSGMSGLLQLSHQLDVIDYKPDNFIHADMTPEEMAKSMRDRKESFLQMMARMMGQNMAVQAKDPSGSSDWKLLAAFFAPDRSRRLKMAMAEQFERMEGSLSALEGEQGSTIITERNKKALTVLQRELAAGKRKIAIFYGAGHLPDFRDRLAAEFDLEQQGETWLTAWKLTAAAAAKAPPAEDAPADDEQPAEPANPPRPAEPAGVE